MRKNVNIQKKQDMWKTRPYCRNNDTNDNSIDNENNNDIEDASGCSEDPEWF